MRKGFSSIVAAFMGYAAIRAFGQEDYAGVYFYGLTSAFAAADLYKACSGKKDLINPSDFSSASVAFLTASTGAVSAYALTIGFEVFKDPVDSVLRSLGGFGVTAIGCKILWDRIREKIQTSSNSQVLSSAQASEEPKP